MTGLDGWKALLAGYGEPGPNPFPLAAYSEFMPAPRLGRKPYGEPDVDLFAEDDLWGWRVSEAEQAWELAPGLEQIARELYASLLALGRGREEHLIRGHGRPQPRGQPVLAAGARRGRRPPRPRALRQPPPARALTHAGRQGAGAVDAARLERARPRAGVLAQLRRRGPAPAQPTPLRSSPACCARRTARRRTTRASSRHSASASSPPDPTIRGGSGPRSCRRGRPRSASATAARSRACGTS